MSNKDLVSQIIQKILNKQELTFEEKKLWTDFLTSRVSANGPLQSVSEYTHTRNLGEFYDWLLTAPGMLFSSDPGIGMLISPSLINVDYSFAKIGTDIEEGPDTSKYINDMCVDINNNILYVVGYFSSFEGVTANGVIKYDITNGVWSSIGSPLTANDLAGINCCVVDSSGNLYVGGNFYDGISKLAKYNGSSWSEVSGGTNGSVYGLALSGTNLYVIGAFTQVGSGPTSASKIAVVNTSTGVWSALGAGLTGAGGAIGRAVELDSSGNVWAAGGFDAAGGLASKSLAYWDGAAWHAVSNGGLDESAYGMDIDSNDVIYITGGFLNTYDSAKSLTRAAKYSGGSWSALGDGLDGAGYDLFVDSYDKAIFLGNFTNRGPYAAEWDGTGWGTLGGGLDTYGTGGIAEGTGVLFIADQFNVYAYYQPYYYSSGSVGYIAESQNNKTTVIHNPAGNVLYPTEAAVRNYAPEKYEKATAPGVNDDEGDLYAVGDLWLDTVNDNLYVAIDVTAAAAVWLDCGPWNGTLIDIDIDGATDIGADLADADLIIVDDGATGTNRKSTLSRIKTYIQALTDTLYSALGHTHTESEITDLTHTDADAIHDNVSAEISLVTEKVSPVSADLVLIEDSEASNAKKKVQVGNLPGGTAWDGNIADIDLDGGTDIGAALADADLILVDDGAIGTNRKSTLSRIKTYIQALTDTLYSALGHTHTESEITDLTHTDADAIHDNVSAEISLVTEKVSPVSADLVLIEDSEASNAKKKVQVGNLPGGTAWDGNIADIDLDGGTDIGAALADADLILVDDGAAGTNRKSALSRVWTWIKTKTDLPLTMIDLDGGTDIGADLADADLILVDDGAAGTNRKSAMSRVWTYIAALIDSTYQQSDGWKAAGVTWTFAGSHQFTVPGDQSSNFDYQPGTKVKMTNNSTTYYGTIIESVYTPSNTTITMATNDDYGLVSGAITNPYVSHEYLPDGWPDWFNFSPSWSASGSMTVSSVSEDYAKFKIEGLMVTAMVGAQMTLGGSADSQVIASAPLPLAESALVPAMIVLRDGSSGSTIDGQGRINTSDEFLFMLRGAGNWSLGSARQMKGVFIYPWTYP